MYQLELFYHKQYFLLYALHPDLLYPQYSIFKTNGYRDKVTGKIVEVTEVEHDDGYVIAIEITNKDASLQWTSKTDVFESIKSR